MLWQGHSTVEIAKEFHCTPAVMRARLGRLRNKRRVAGYND
jgi:hypothetical protein